MIKLTRTFLPAISLFFITSTSGQTQRSKLEISELATNFYVFTTYNIYKGNPTPANGMYLVTNSGVALFDSPWDTTQFQPLLDSIKVKHNKSDHIMYCDAFTQRQNCRSSIFERTGSKNIHYPTDR